MQILKCPQIKRANLVRAFRALLLVVAAFGSLFAWAFASPIGAPPDGDFHMASIWCAQGDRLGMCKVEKVKDSNQVELLTPRTFSRYQNPYGHFCYVGNSGASGGCTNIVDETSVTELVASGRIFPVDQVSSPFYDFNSRLSSRNIETSAFKIRFANVLFFIGIASLLLTIFRKYRVATSLAFLVGLGPWGSFLISSIHPSAWTITLLPLFLVCLFVVIREKSIVLRIFAGLAALLIWFVAQDVRGDSRFFMVIALFAAIIWGIKIRHEITSMPLWLKFSGAAVFAIIYLHFLHPLVRRVLGSSEWSQTDRVFDLTTTKLPLTLMNLFGGNYGLGSSDTPLSDLVVFCGVTSLFLIIYTTAQRVSKRNWLIVSTVVIVLLLLTLYADLGDVGTSGRYILPLYLMCLITYLASVETSFSRPLITSRTISRILVFTLTLGNSIALHQTMRRYITGIDVIGWNLNKNAEWWWTVGPSPMTIWMLGTIAFGLTATLVLQMARVRVEQ
jgi:hypothetical protein